MKKEQSINQGERIQKLLANAGWGSRRQIEALISEGQILLNNKPAKLGDRAVPGDRLRMGRRIHEVKALSTQTLPKVLLYHKPEGELVTRQDPEGRKTVFGNLPRLPGGRWIVMSIPGKVPRMSLTGPVNPVLLEKRTGNSGIFSTPGFCENRANSCV